MSEQSWIPDSLSYSCIAIVLDALLGVRASENACQSTGLAAGILKTPPRSGHEIKAPSVFMREFRYSNTILNRIGYPGLFLIVCSFQVSYVKITRSGVNIYQYL